MKIYSIASAAKEMGVSRTYLTRLISDGHLKAIKYEGYSARVSQRAIDDYICRGEKNHRDSGDALMDDGTSTIRANATAAAQAAARRQANG
ncbi:MAG: helix-turn-helix domain-containing protein [Candidatus Thalassarchaeaceae archaeon]